MLEFCLLEDIRGKFTKRSLENQIFGGFLVVDFIDFVEFISVMYFASQKMHDPRWHIPWL